jgi:hypothetical protein
MYVEVVYGVSLRHKSIGLSGIYPTHPAIFQNVLKMVSPHFDRAGNMTRKVRVQYSTLPSPFLGDDECVPRD